MYEKPQYLTPNGFKRLPKNPYKKQLEMLPKAPTEKPAQSVTLPPQRPPVLLPAKRNQQGLSDKAAKLIAQALKGMLKKA